MDISYQKLIKDPIKHSIHPSTKITRISGPGSVVSAGGPLAGPFPGPFAGPFLSSLSAVWWPQTVSFCVNFEAQTFQLQPGSH